MQSKQTRITNFYVKKREMECNLDDSENEASKKTKFIESESSNINDRKSPRKVSESPLRRSPRKSQIKQACNSEDMEIPDKDSASLLNETNENDISTEDNDNCSPGNGNNLKEETIENLPSSLETVDDVGEEEETLIEDDGGITQEDKTSLQAASTSQEKTWKGVSLDCLRSQILQNNLTSAADFKPNSQHVIFIQMNSVTHRNLPKPYPHQYSDRWDNQHVKLPCSNENLYFANHKKGKKEFTKRWQIIENSLKSDDLKSSVDLEEAIMSYNNRFNNSWSFTILHQLFTEENRELIEEYKDFVIPGMIRLAMNLPHIVTKPIPLLKQNEERSLTFSQYQIASLLANAFLCTYPRRNTQGKNAEYGSYPSINFNTLFQEMDSDNSRGKIPCKREKLKCILHYFKRVLTNPPTGTVTFSRRVLSEESQVDWSKSQNLFNFDLHVNSAGTIEDDGSEMIEADFANCMVGGGVLRAGCVQEEIRFVLCPEMIVSRLFTECLLKHETLLIEGAERFSRYSGYASSFKWVGDFVEGQDNSNTRDQFGRWKTTVVAIDALVFRGRYNSQFKNASINRELNKAYCGFSNSLCPWRFLSPVVATGNWGCGAFAGDHRLKALIQMLVCAELNKNLSYFTFNDKKLRDDIHEIHEILREKGLKVGEIWCLIEQFTESCDDIEKSKINLFDFMLEKVSNKFCDMEPTLETLVDYSSSETENSNDST